MREALPIALVGVALGVTMAMVAAQGLRSFLFAVAPTDAVTLAVATALLLGGVLQATYWPSRRAAHMDPVKAIRGE
jgi:ABC-type antimicrobial peptide transport system permease subunit